MTLLLPLGIIAFVGAGIYAIGELLLPLDLPEKRERRRAP